jgi:hypothetical protein
MSFQMFAAGLCDSRCVTLGLSLPVDPRRTFCRAQLVPYLASVDPDAVGPTASSDPASDGNVLTTLCQQAVHCVPSNEPEQLCVALSDGQCENGDQDLHSAVGSWHYVNDTDDMSLFCEGVFRLNTSDNIVMSRAKRECKGLNVEHSSVALPFLRT